jgi:hypothetical protein
MTDDKKNFQSIGEYLVAKNGTTKYIKLAAAPNAPEEVKQKVARLIEANGGDILYVNLFDNDFRAKYKIPDFAKGRITSPQDGGDNGGSKGKQAKKDGVNF